MKRIAGFAFALLLVGIVVCSGIALAAPSETESSAISVNASELASQLGEVPEHEGKVSLLGVLCWVVIGLGVAFIIYILLASGRKKKGVRPKELKYRRSPYKKNRRKMESEYYRYKRNKYQ